ncbi:MULTISPECIES: response regulator [Clostridium]|uniref:Stage 0 sporulation protein A homolog n=3 Tax=Clostridium TaxID=1485 RepID=D8GS60_CLOLD|nr:MULTISPECIES: response regulator [Clostridium]ADK14413.1 putative signal receiver domain protein [Clostridium ljungdahlii DSM 13528]AGY77632.1 response regulator [Clostridium autoethanogenum DSM 10061]ALU37771.1 Response regulator [Clostridium autoethanogenum DSM 10061]OAA88166.1 Chemotaxis protein CheY [Clostridium ljungdahlii DSM 13528]OVY49878.1 Chemotaxis protein CheY [Clostridium autoethanogenum]
MGKKNILIIDDSLSVRQFIRKILEKANYKVYEAGDGEEGIKVFKESGNIDLVITDIYMPKKSGIEVLIELKKEYEDLKIIILSDGGEKDFSDENGICEDLGATYFFKKNWVKDELIELVNRIFIK